MKRNSFEDEGGYRRKFFETVNISSHGCNRGLGSVPQKLRERHFALVVVVGTIIKTDHQYGDYLWIEHVAIKDIKKDVWIKSPWIKN